MASWADVERLATALPGVAEGTSYGNRAWKVAGKLFVWHRPLRRSELASLGDDAPGGAVLGLYVSDEGEKAELCAAEADVCFTIPHFDGYPVVLVRLDDVDADLLAELVTDAWRVRAPASRHPSARTSYPQPRD